MFTPTLERRPKDIRAQGASPRLVWRFIKKLLGAIFPTNCLGCGKITEDEIICEKCFSEITVNQTLFCGKCRARLAENRRVCHKDFPFILGAATSYNNEAVRGLIHRLKFKYLRSASLPLGKLTVDYLKNLGIPLKNFSILPIPLSKKRLKERGFNQSELIAKYVATELKLELVDDGLIRTKNSKPQSETKNATERKENVHGAFSVQSQQAISGKNIIILDDVITSGSTMEEAARTLKSAGAKKIIAVTVAAA